MRKHEFEEYDIEQFENARKYLMKVLDYHYGDSKMRNEVNRLETIIKKLDYLIPSRKGGGKTALK